MSAYCSLFWACCAWDIKFSSWKIVSLPQKRTLDRFGITDSYPATASLTTLTYHTSALSEIPDLAYIRPYDDDLALATLS